MTGDETTITATITGTIIGTTVAGATADGRTEDAIFDLGHLQQLALHFAHDRVVRRE